ncbi:MAG: ATP-binding protein, partial [Bacteroidota bacterium]
KNYRNASEALNQIAFLYWEHNYFGKAAEYYERSIIENQKLGNSIGIGKIQNNLGMLYADIGQYQKSVDYFEKAIESRRKLNDQVGQIDPLINKAVSLQRIPNREAETIKAIKKALQISLSENDLTHARLAYGMLSETYQKLNEADSAAKYFDLYRTFYEKSQKVRLDQLTEEAKKARLQAEVADLERQKQALEIDLQQEQLREQQRELAVSDSTSEALYQDLNRKELLLKLLEEKRAREEQARIQQEKEDFQFRMILIAGILVVGVIALLLLRANQIKQRSNRMLISKNAEISQQKEEIVQQADSIKQANLKLTELGSFKQAAINMIVHDLKNPLNTILGYTQGFTDHRIRLVNQAGQQMLNLTLNMLDVNKAGEANLTPNLEELSLDELATEALEQVNLAAFQHNVKVRTELEVDYFLMLDKELSTRILVNLLTNAIKYSSANDTVYLKASSLDAQNRVKIQVIDQGAGISPEQQESLFSGAYQIGDNAQKLGATPATGIGLQFCKIATEAQSGKIGVESREGEGSTFWLEFPYERISTETASISQAQAEDEQGKLSDEDLQYLLPYKKQLQELEIFQTSKVKAVLDQIPPDVAPNVLEWRATLEKATYTLNEALFVQLTQTEERYFPYITAM